MIRKSHEKEGPDPLGAQETHWQASDCHVGKSLVCGSSDATS